MKVIGAGFGRTGTMSLKVALEELGAGPCLHALEARRADSGVASHWEQLANGQPVDWHKAFEGWGSTVDWLGARFYPQMLQAWPQAKVILSVRDPEDWYESCHASLHATRELAGGLRGAGEVVPVLKAIDSAIWEDLFDGRFDERDHALQVFERHRLQVARTVPAQRLLIYDIREGWQPLCDFLGVPMPKTPFPHLNGRDAFWTRFGSRPTRRGNGNGAPNGASSASRSRLSPSPAGALGEQALPRITGLSTADPGVTLDQGQMLDLLGLAEDEFAQRIFGRCGVQRRRMHLTPKMLKQPLQGRTAEVEDQLLAWSVQAVEQLDVDPKQIGTVVTATLYSLGGPTLAHRLGEHFQMDPAVDKYHLSGVGCASAVPLIRLAQGALANHPRKQCLIVGAESMSGLLSHASEGDPRSKTVGSAIFGDGCAAMLLGEGEQGDGPSVIASQVHQVPDSLDAVCMQCAPQDSYLHLIRELPDVAGEHVGGLVERFLARQGMTGHMIDHWIIHPGGRRIIECAQQALRLPDEHVRISFELLADRGNVGTPSIFYVIAETIRQRQPRADEHGLVVTIGPGVSIGLMLLRW